MLTSGSPHHTTSPFPLPLPQKRLTPHHESILHASCHPYFIGLSTPSLSKPQTGHLPTYQSPFTASGMHLAGPASAAASTPPTSPRNKYTAHPPLYHNPFSVGLVHGTGSASPVRLSTAAHLQRLIHAPHRRLFVHTPRAAPPTPPSTAFDPLRRHHPQPYRSHFTDTNVSPTRLAPPIPFSSLPGPLCQLTSPRPQIRFPAPSSNLSKHLLTPHPTSRHRRRFYSRPP